VALEHIGADRERIAVRCVVDTMKGYDDRRAPQQDLVEVRREEKLAQNVFEGSLQGAAWASRWTMGRTAREM